MYINHKKGWEGKNEMTHMHDPRLKTTVLKDTPLIASKSLIMRFCELLGRTQEIM